MYVISYCALGLLALIMIGLVAHDALARLWRERPKRLWECVVVLVFAAGMLESMAVKPGSRGRASAPAAHSATDGIVSRQSDSSGVSTNAVPSWEEGLAFRSFVWTPSNVVAELAWPSGFFVAPIVLDVLAAFPALTNDWRWIGFESVPSGATNLVFAVSAADLDLSAMPEALFLRAAERIGFNSNMDDFDGDGLPNLYELHHGTNPYVPDAALAPRLSVGTPGGYGSLKAALAASSAFSIVDVAAGDYPQDATIVMPPHPVLVSGPTGGYAVIRSTAPIAAFELNAAQTESTLFRNLYLVLDAQSGFQSGFWCGGNLPWSGESASATFRNVRIAFRNPEPEYFGWHFYRPGMNRAVIADCLVDARGATWATGIYGYDAPPIVTNGNHFIRFPEPSSNRLSAAVYLYDSSNRTARVSFENETNGYSRCGYRLDGVYSASADSDGDGLSDYDEIFVHDADPWLADSDGDGATDFAEIASGADPMDYRSFIRSIRAEIDNTTDPPDVTNYVACGESAGGWSDVGRIAIVGKTGTGTLTAVTDGGSFFVKAFRDLNRNGVFDAEADVFLEQGVAARDGVEAVKFAFGDLDRDSIPDEDERADGTNPYDPSNYRYSTSAAVWEVFAASNRLTVAGYFGTNLVYGPCFAQTNHEAIALDSQTTATRERFSLCYWDDANANLRLDEGEARTSFEVLPFYNAKTNYVHLPLGGFDANGNGLLDYWELQSGLLDSGLAYSATTDTDGDGLINLHEYWAGTNPLVPDGSNTLLSVISRSVDDRLTADPTGRIGKFRPEAYGLLLNTNCWAYGVDTSCASPYYCPSSSTNIIKQRAGTAIASTLIVFAEHFRLPVGANLYFYGSNGIVYSRRMVRSKFVAGDIYMGLLDSPLPSAVKPAKLLPTNYEEYLGWGRYLPVLAFDQEEKALVFELDNLPLPHETSYHGQYPAVGFRRRYCENVISGDSGNPIFLVVGDDVVLISTFTSGMTGAGPFYSKFMDKLIQVADELCPGVELGFFNQEECGRFSINP